MLGFLKKILDSNEKTLSQIRPLVERINSFEDDVKKLKDGEFLEKTAQFKTRLAKDETPDDLLPEAFALVREAAGRTIGERHYDVQMLAAIVLHKGSVAEQKTGEGKTLSSIPALYLNSLSGRGVHLVTVNDYLARRDAGWMGPIFHLLGVSVSAMIHDQSFIYDPEFQDNSASDPRLVNLRPISRREAYAADVTYGINSEFGFDYLRDNMVSDASQIVQRGFHYAVVDEVDSVLIDEARTPHIISAPDTEPTKKYYEYAKIVEKLDPSKDYAIDEKLRLAHLSEEGILKIEKILGISNLYEKDFATVHHLEAALKAKTLFKLDKDYVVKDGEVIIVDEFTGRLLQGRRFSEGLHQAIEAKEGVNIQQESRTLATVSLQNYFRMYEKLSGMTGTAATEAEEFHRIYNLDVVVIPTHKNMIREDKADMVYKTNEAKFAAVAEEIAERHKQGQPILVGTTSINKNEMLSELLLKKGIPHELLNAKNHLKEASIIANAGKKGMVTVATNMAGRGVDIILGGALPNKEEIGKTITQKEFNQAKKDWQKAHDEVVSLGGLYVLGTERHESRRIDNQLRGRSGRQGDPGTSRFYVALDDDIMRLFGGEHVARMMTMFKLPDDVPLEHGMVSRAIEQAQVKVEGFHFDSRKHLVEYDDVLNKQREIIYGQRRKIVTGENVREMIQEKLTGEIGNLVAMYSDSGISEKEKEKILDGFITIIPFESASQKNILSHLANMKSAEQIKEFLQKTAKETYAQKVKQLGEELMLQVERWVAISVVDNLWMGHLDAIDDLREGIGLRGYGQLDPLVEYKNEAFSMFERLLMAIDDDITHRIFKVQVQLSPDSSAVASAKADQIQTDITREAVRENQARDVKTRLRQGFDGRSKKLSRNDPCWCGSGKKYKKCHYPELPSYSNS